MTTTTSNCITSLYSKVGELAIEALSTKLSIDFPTAYQDSFAQTMYLVEKLELPLSTDIIENQQNETIALIEKKYPGQLEALTNKLDELIKQECFDVEILPISKTK